MKIPTVKEYKDAIQNALRPQQIVGLQILYQFPDASATAKELAHEINPANPATIIASGKIGRTGKRIAEYLGVVPDNYYNGRRERPAYFTIISETYEQNIGWTMRPNLKKALEELKLVNQLTDEIIERLPTETSPYEDEQFYRDGKVIEVFVNRFERNQNARIKCITHYGHKCQGCGFDFGLVYGEIAEGFIHVHHLKQLSDIRQEYLVDPIKDLIPLCANCHSVVHLEKPALTIERLRKLIKKSNR